MENPNSAFDPANLPAFVATGPLEIDLNEIEHQFYMFDHRCVGCIVLMCIHPADSEIMGRVSLSGDLIEDCFWLPLTLPQVGQALSLVVPVRGKVDYGSSYTLRLEGFRLVDGSSIDPIEMTLTTRPRAIQNPAYFKHDTTALEAARQGIVLLKNDESVLPLREGSMLNLFGEGVTNYRIGATGAGRINPRFSLNLRDALRFTSCFSLNEELSTLYETPSNTVPSKAALERAKEKNDTAVIVLTRGTGENIDNSPLPGEYYLSDNEHDMISAICSVFGKTVVILNTGYPIDMRWTESYNIKALIYTGLAGQASAQALCEILDGRISPSGKLPDTWAWDYWDIPASVNFITRKEGEKPILTDEDVWVDTCYEEGIYVGYRYFETFQKEVAFPFGHGLSYTDFTMEVQSPVYNGTEVRIDAVVTNIGREPGREVVMAFVKLPGTSQEQPTRQLVAFGKTDVLLSGKSQTISLCIAQKNLTTYNVERSAYLLEKGAFDFYVGSSVKKAKHCGSIFRKEDSVLLQTRHRLPCPVEIDEMSQTGKLWPRGGMTIVREDAHSLDKLLRRNWVESNNSFFRSPTERILYDALAYDPSKLDGFVSQLSTDTLARLNMMYGHGWSMDAKGEAGRMAPLKEFDVPSYVCADGNCGVNVNKPNIGMPTSTVVCATFNPHLAREVGRVIGEEAVENDVQLILAPGMNIHRNPLCGRHAEYFSEDPYLTGVMAAAQVQGLHDAGVSDSVKHLATNNCETARQRNHSLVGERALREIYLRAFEVLIDHVKPDSIMTSYNALNGCMCGCDPVLLEGILREEFGFDGFVMTDWNSYNTVDMVDSVNAGVSWLTPGENDGSRVAVLLKAIEAGRISRARLEENIKRMIAIMIRRMGKGGEINEDLLQST